MSFANGKARQHASLTIWLHRPVTRDSICCRLSSRPVEARWRRTIGSGLCCVLFAILFFPFLCKAEISLEARVGFHGVFQLGRPFPLGVVLRNSGRPTEGTLEIQVFKSGATMAGAPYPLIYRRELFLSAQSEKTLQFTVDPDYISRPLTITFESPSGKTSRELDLRRHFTPTPVVLLLSGGAAASPVAIGAASSNRLVGLSLSELPADPRALLGVSHLIFYDQSLRELSRFQLLALDHWITSGGHLLIVGSLNYALYQEPSMSRFLPVRVTGTKRVNFFPSRAEGDSVAPIADVWTQVSTVVAGRVISENQGIPVLVENHRGKGKIVYLAMDVGRPPLSQWEGLPRFMQTLLAPPGADDPSPRTHWDDAVFSQLILTPSFVSTYVPTVSFFLAIVGYLAGVGLLTWLWQQRRIRQMTFMVCLIVFVSISGLGGYLLFSRGGNVPDGVFLSATVMENSAHGYVESQTNLVLFSTQIRQYSLQLERGWIDMVPVSTPARERPEKAVVLQDGGGFSRYQLALREWDYRLFRMRFVDRFPLHVEFEQQGESLLMKLENLSAKDLIDCWLLVPGHRYALGNIPRGTSWRKVFSLAGANAKESGGLGRGEGLNLRELSFGEKTRDILFHSSFFPRDREISRWSRGALVFFGWVKDPEPRLRIDDPRIRIYDYTLFRSILPLGGAEDE